jgi:DNA-binding PadR family transcriptional regulator
MTVDQQHIDLLRIIGGDLKRVASTNGGEYAGACPFCGGTDRFRVWPHQDVPGWWCRGCEEKGDAIAFVQKRDGIGFLDACEQLGLRTEHERNGNGNGRYAAATKRAYRGLADYAQAHGVPTEVFERAGWRETRNNNRAALVFQTPSGPRWRFIDGGEQTYTHNPKFKASLYGLEGAGELAQQSGMPLVLTNGEASVIAAQYYGVPAVTLAGGGERRYPDELAGELQQFHGGSFLIALENDGKKTRAAHDLAAQFGAPVVDLGSDMDLADFCNLHREDSANALLRCGYRHAPDQAASAPAGRVPRLLSSEDVLNLPPAEWLIDSVLPANDLSLLYGLPGTGKSMIALDIACVVSQVAPVVYVAAEALPTNTTRLAAWQTHYGLKTPDLHWWSGPVNLLDSVEVTAFLLQISDIQPALIIFDTLAMCLPGEESTSKDMGGAVDELMRIQRATGAAVLPIHHSDKTGTTPRGHSSLIGASACIIKVTNDDGLITFRSEKQRNAQQHDPRLFRLVQKPEVGGVVVLPTSKIDHRNSPPGELATRILEELCENIHTGGLILKEIADAVGLHSTTVTRSLKNLEAKGYVAVSSESGKRSKIYVPTQAGREFIRQKEQQQADVAQAAVGQSHLNWNVVIKQHNGQSHPNHTLITPDHSTADTSCDSAGCYTPIEGFDSASESLITPITPETPESTGDVIKNPAQITPDHSQSHPNHTQITPMCDLKSHNHTCVPPLRGHSECDLDICEPAAWVAAHAESLPFDLQEARLYIEAQAGPVGALGEWMKVRHQRE